jgi:hypothetical protein
LWATSLAGHLAFIVRPLLEPQSRLELNRIIMDMVAMVIIKLQNIGIATIKEVGRIIIIVDLFRIIMAASISKVNCSLS